MLKEFKDFAFKGNLIDMAVGFIVGGAFGTVMKSLVDDIFMPFLGLLGDGGSFKDKFITLKAPEGVDTAGMTVEAAKETGAVLLTYGNFISAMIAFLLVAAAVFIVIVKLVGSLMKEDEPEEADPEPTNEEKILEVLQQIRDKS